MPFDRFQNLGPNCLNLLKPNGENSGCLGVLFQKLCFKSCIDMKNVGNGPFDRSQNMEPNCGNFLDIWDSP